MRASLLSRLLALCFFGVQHRHAASTDETLTGSAWTLGTALFRDPSGAKSMTRPMLLGRLRCLVFGHSWENVSPEYISVYVEKKVCKRCALHEDISILLTVSRYREPPQANEQAKAAPLATGHD